MAEIQEKIIEKRKSVGLIVLTRGSPGGPLIAILRRRGKYKWQKRIKRESYPGACQVTAHGKLKWGETSKETLWRKVKEELGDVFFNIAKLEDRDPRLLVDDKERMVKTYGVWVYPQCVERMFFDFSSGGIDYISLDEIDKIQELTKADKETGITDFNIIAMFPDEIKALKEAVKAFAFLNHK